MLIRGAVVVAVGAVVMATMVRMLGGQVRGPYGTFPNRPIADGAPLHTMRLVGIADTSGPVLVYRGLAIGGPLFDGGVHAVRIATGAPFWRYDIPSRPIGLDHARGVVVAVQDGDQGTVVALDARSGRPRWSARVPQIGHIDTAVVPAAGGPDLLVSGEDGAAVLGRETGDVRRVAPWPRGSECVGGLFHPHVVVGGTVAFTCSGPYDDEYDDDAVIGLDLATGRRWITHAGTLFQGHASRDDEFVRLVGTGEQDRVAVLHYGDRGDELTFLDPATGRVAASRKIDGGREGELVAYREGVQIGSCGRRPTFAVCATDPDTGRSLWRRRLGANELEFHSPVIAAENHLYALVEASGKPEPWQRLLVLDPGTGRPLGSWRLPAGYSSDGFETPVTDGVLTVSGLSEKGGIDYLFADAPGVTHPRELFTSTYPAAS